MAFTASFAGPVQTGTANRFRMFQSTARSYQSGAQSIPNATETALTLDTNDFNTDGMWASGSNTRLTAPIGGKYLIAGGVNMAAAGLGTTPYIAIRKNGTTDFALSSLASAGEGAVTDILSLAAADYVEIVVYQNSGAPVNTAGNIRTFGAMLYVGE